MVSPAISIVLPVSNQADHIESVVTSYDASLKTLGTGYEVILVVNGSTDDTLRVCARLAERVPSVETLHTLRRGWGHAVRLGLQEARGDLLCYTNSARTTAQDLYYLLAYAVADPGVVIKAERKSRERWLRSIGSRLYNLECRVLFGLSCSDVNGTPKVFPRNFHQLLSLGRDDDLIDLEFAVICKREGYPIREVGIMSAKRHGGRSTTNYASAIRMYWGAVTMRRQLRRQAKPDPVSYSP